MAIEQHDTFPRKPVFGSTAAIRAQTTHEIFLTSGCFNDIPIDWARLQLTKQRRNSVIAGLSGEDALDDVWCDGAPEVRWIQIVA